MKNMTVEVPVVTPGKAEYTAYLTTYIPSNPLDLPLHKCRPAVVIFPGGGYGGTYDGEAEPVALNFTAKGICAFVLRYSCKPAVFPQALCEALWCVKYVRDHAAEYGIDPKNIATLGFSAGGHLCASTGTLWNREFLREYLPGNAEDYRPDKLILCYPVIYSHMGSLGNLLADRVTDDKLFHLNLLHNQVGEHVPPTFFWHTFEDTGVPVQNSLKFALALADLRIPIEMHVYPHGPHGLCTGDHTSRADVPFTTPLHVNEWLAEAIRFSFDKTLL